MVYKIVAEDPVPPHRLNATLTGPIENALRKALAKKPDARFRTCIEFAGTLEEACSASKGWRPLARGAGGAEPTAGDAAGMAAMTGKTTVPSMPPGRKPNRSGDATTVERAAKKKSGFMPFLAAILMAGALLALIGWQAAPWLGSDNRKQASPPDDTPVAVPQTPAPKVAANTQGKDGELSRPAIHASRPAGADGPGRHGWNQASADGARATASRRQAARNQAGRDRAAHAGQIEHGKIEYRKLEYGEKTGRGIPPRGGRAQADHACVRVSANPHHHPTYNAATATLDGQQRRGLLHAVRAHGLARPPYGGDFESWIPTGASRDQRGGR